MTFLLSGVRTEKDWAFLCLRGRVSGGDLRKRDGACTVSPAQRQDLAGASAGQDTEPSNVSLTHLGILFLSFVTQRSGEMIRVFIPAVTKMAAFVGFGHWLLLASMQVSGHHQVPGSRAACQLFCN